MTTNRYAIDPDGLNDTEIYTTAFNAAMQGLMAQRNWTYLSDPLNVPEIVDLALLYAADALVKNRALLDAFEKGGSNWLQPIATP